MAKHPHRLRLHQKKTWRCMIPGCRYFIHRGLEYTLPGQQAMCWECGEEFMLDEEALKDDDPICDSCRLQKTTGRTSQELSDFIATQMVLGKVGVKSLDEIPETRRNMLKALGVLPKVDIKMPPPEDEIETIEPTHAPECSIHNGGECDCM